MGVYESSVFSVAAELISEVFYSVVNIAVNTTYDIKISTFQ